MSESRTVVVTGASRGLGLATAAHLYKQGWRVVGAMRSPGRGLELLRAAAGATAEDPRLIGVTLDLADSASIESAAEAIQAQVGAPDVLIHNAGIAATGMTEELPMELWNEMLATHLLGPVQLTKALLPSMRAAGRGRIVVISSQGGIRGMPSISAYSAAKGGLERWAESLAGEVWPFGIGVTVLVAGTFDTDLITEAGTSDYRDFAGPYGGFHPVLDRRGLYAMRFANDPQRFARQVAKSLDRHRGPFVRRGVGVDARMLLLANRLLPAVVLHRGVAAAMGLSRRRAAQGTQGDVSTQAGER